MKNVKNYEKMIRYDERIMKYAEKWRNFMNHRILEIPQQSDKDVEARELKDSRA